jgi:hypothetical protein
MIELYFLLYRVPKMMSQLAKERNRSARLWAILGIFAWVGGEFVVFFLFGVVSTVGELAGLWTVQDLGGYAILLYIAAIGAAIGSFAFVRRILRSLPVEEDAESPPAPPTFS